jgi:hypothetical protein
MSEALSHPKPSFVQRAFTVLTPNDSRVSGSADHGISERQYKTRIDKWNSEKKSIHKNIKTKDMKSVVRKTQRRAIGEPDKAGYRVWVNQNEVPPAKIHRWMQMHSVPEDELYEPSSAACTLPLVGQLDFSNSCMKLPHRRSTVAPFPKWALRDLAVSHRFQCSMPYSKTTSTKPPHLISTIIAAPTRALQIAAVLRLRPLSMVTTPA